mmetsp:Transcript_12514/g.44306  ORF Transcript_12514/g.44306 Transcript_12514/m.44306 type:complete len:103 (+) Transcript_12514:93-401(+)
MEVVDILGHATSIFENEIAKHLAAWSQVNMRHDFIAAPGKIEDHQAAEHFSLENQFKFVHCSLCTAARCSTSSCPRKTATTSCPSSAAPSSRTVSTNSCPTG